MEWKEEDKSMTGVFNHNKVNENTTASPPNVTEIESSKSNSSVVTKPTQTNIDPLDSSQNLPKKKGGFKITRVIEVDGDDSGDELEDPSADVSSGVAQEFEMKARAGSIVSINNEHLSESAHDLPVVDKSNAPSHSSTKIVQSITTASESVSSEATKTSVIATATSTTPSKPGASRIYKVVKRESIFPERRDASRWICFDFSDIQTANSTFAIQSSNESRSNSFHSDSFHSHQFSSMTATAIPLNQSYQSQFADVPAHYHKDYRHSANSLSSNEFIPHSESTSSVYHDGDGQRIVTALKPVIEMSHELMKRQVLSDDSRISEASSSDQDILKSAPMFSDAGSAPDTEDDSISAHFRIDTKIEAAMDLVKKHLMVAVRDEVNELKDRIVELQTENEAMRNLLSPEQLNRAQSNYNQMMIKGTLLPTQSSFGQSKAAMKKSHSVSKANRPNQSFRQSASSVLSSSFSIDSTSASSAYEQLPLSAKQNVYPTTTTTPRGSTSSAVTSRNPSLVQNNGAQQSLHSQANYLQPNPTMTRQTSASGHLPRSVSYQHQGPPGYSTGQGNKHPVSLPNQPIPGVRQPYQTSSYIQGHSGSHSQQPRATTGQYQSVYPPLGHGPASTAPGAQERALQFSPTSMHTSSNSNAPLNQRLPAPQMSNSSIMSPTTPHPVGHAQAPAGPGVVAGPIDHT